MKLHRTKKSRLLMTFKDGRPVPAKEVLYTDTGRSLVWTVAMYVLIPPDTEPEPEIKVNLERLQ